MSGNKAVSKKGRKAQKMENVHSPMSFSHSLTLLDMLSKGLPETKAEVKRLVSNIHETICQGVSTKVTMIEASNKKEAVQLFCKLLAKVDNTCDFMVGDILVVILHSVDGELRLYGINNIISSGNLKPIIRCWLNQIKKRSAVSNIINCYECLIMSLANKDTEFVASIESMNVSRTITEVASNIILGRAESLSSFLIILRKLAINEKMAERLITDGLLLPIRKAIQNFDSYNDRSKQQFIKLLNIFAKTEKYLVQVIEGEFTGHLIKHLAPWKRTGVKGGSISNITYKLLDTMTNIDTGLELFRKKGYFASLGKLCMQCPDDRKYQTFLLKTCLLLLKEQEKKELPILSNVPALTFRLTTPVSVKDCAPENIIDLSEEEISEEEDEEEEEEQPVDVQIGDVSKAVESVGIPDKIEELTKYNSIIQYHIIFSEIIPALQSLKLTDLKDPPVYTTLSMFENLDMVTASKRFLTNISDIELTEDELFALVRRNTVSLVPFTKVPFPELTPVECTNESFDEHLSFTSKMISRIIDGCEDTIFKPTVVYDLDEILASPQIKRDITQAFKNEEPLELGKPANCQHLIFDSRFECGNLRKAIRVGEFEYDLITTPDVNSIGYTNWFLFSVANMIKNTEYTFNIINIEKKLSTKCNNMKILLYSVNEAIIGNPEWVRAGYNIKHVPNNYVRPTNKNRRYCTYSFSLTFKHQYDICYISYAIPYSYTHLMAKIYSWLPCAKKNGVYFRADRLCTSEKNNEVPILTLTAMPLTTTMDRKIIFLTCRVHPGETNASWVMDGLIKCLIGTSENARKCLEQYIFKIIPMLNVDGVINGCQRCGLSGEDQNRVWGNPDHRRHPAIFHTKELIRFMIDHLNTRPYIFCDFHGHAMKKNCFMYGCLKDNSEKQTNRVGENPNDLDVKALPNAMNMVCGCYSSKNTHYRVTRTLESTARITLWREFKIKKSYTFEVSFYGADKGPGKGFYFNAHHYQMIGERFIAALAQITRSPPVGCIERPRRPTGALQTGRKPTEGMKDSSSKKTKKKNSKKNRKNK